MDAMAVAVLAWHMLPNVSAVLWGAAHARLNPVRMKKPAEWLRISHWYKECFALVMHNLTTGKVGIYNGKHPERTICYKLETS